MQELLKMVETATPPDLAGRLLLCLEERMERYIDKETGEVFEESENDTLRKETLKYIRSDDDEKYSYKPNKA